MYRALRTAPRMLMMGSRLTSLHPMSGQSVDKKVQEVPNPPSIDAKTKAEMECPAEENQENAQEENLEHGVNVKFAAMAEKIQKDAKKQELKAYCSPKSKTTKPDNSKNNNRKQANQ